MKALLALNVDIKSVVPADEALFHEPANLAASDTVDMEVARRACKNFETHVGVFLLHVFSLWEGVATATVSAG
jgi:hypothetical protein